MANIFEIRKAGFINQGAAMMLIAATSELKKNFPESIIAVAPDGSLPFEPRARLGLWHRATLERMGLDLGKSINIIPQKLRRRYGFVTEDEIDVIIDAAGLAYSDQWGAMQTQQLAKHAKRWAKQNKKLILLPQALGPFTTPEIRTAIHQIADYAALIYARDKISYQHITEVVGQRDNIRIGPDFTNLLKGYIPEDFKLSGALVALVPNCRMLDKADNNDKQGYVAFMQSCARKLEAAQMTPFFLIHEGPEDYRLGELINEGLDKPLAIIQYDDPMATKGILGCCHGVIASRFHALVSALSQGVPSLGTGWNHKYQALFEDYGCPQALLSAGLGDAELNHKLNLITDSEQHEVLVNTLKSHKDEIKGKSRQTWDEVIAEIKR